LTHLLSCKSGFTSEKGIIRIYLADSSSLSAKAWPYWLIRVPVKAFFSGHGCFRRLKRRAYLRFAFAQRPAVASADVDEKRDPDFFHERYGAVMARTKSYFHGRVAMTWSWRDFLRQN